MYTMQPAGISKKRTKRTLPKEAVEKLNAWLSTHWHSPYPSESEKETLSKSTGLSVTQVNNWFVNARVRKWRRSGKPVKQGCRGSLPDAAVSILKDWLRCHWKHPYPNPAEKEQLSLATGLTVKQINYWFVNARRRHWRGSSDPKTLGSDSDQDSPSHNYSNDSKDSMLFVPQQISVNEGDSHAQSQPPNMNNSAFAPSINTFYPSHQPGYLEQLHSTVKREQGSSKEEEGSQDHSHPEISSPPVGEDDMGFFQSIFQDPMNHGGHGHHHHHNSGNPNPMFNIIAPQNQNQNQVQMAIPNYMYQQHQQQYFGWPAVQQQRSENFVLEKELEDKMQQYTTLLQNLKRQENNDNGETAQSFETNSGGGGEVSSADNSSPSDTSNDEAEDKVPGLFGSLYHGAPDTIPTDQRINCDAFLHYSEDVPHNYFSSLC